MRDEAVERKSACSIELEREREVALRHRRTVDGAEDPALHPRYRHGGKGHHGFGAWDADENGRTPFARREERGFHRLGPSGCFERVVDTSAGRVTDGVGGRLR